MKKLLKIFFGLLVIRKIRQNQPQKPLFPHHWHFDLGVWLVDAVGVFKAAINQEALDSAAAGKEREEKEE